MSTHEAVVIVKARAPLETRQVPTVKPGPGQVLVKNEWTSSTPVDLHQADGGLLIKEYPYRIGDGIGGTVVEVGPGVKHLAVGDQAFGFTWRTQEEKAQQVFVTTDAYLLGKLPAGISMQAAVTLPNNAVTAFHTLVTELGIDLPWPKPADYTHPAQDLPFLVWGGSGSVGQYTIQVLKYYGFTRVYATASKRHHELLKSYGATQVFDYSDADVTERIRAAAEKEGGIAYAVDAIGSLKGTVKPLARTVTSPSAKVAIMLPVIVRDASESAEPVYGMDVTEGVNWAQGVEAIGVRTHFYLKNEMFREKLQPEIIPELLAKGVLLPNKQKIVEGETMLERAQRALDALRERAVSGERLVWRVAD